VAVRFDVERALVAGRLAVADVPEAWNAAMRRLVGLAPKDDGEGCLQDIHWAMGGLGYFPKYTLGNLYAAQLFEAAQRELPGLDDAIASGELVVLRDWLRTRIHRHGRRHPAAELIERATGSPPGNRPLPAPPEGPVRDGLRGELRRLTAAPAEPCRRRGIGSRRSFKPRAPACRSTRTGSRGRWP
jgi:carboxypeptidase Taq